MNPAPRQERTLVRQLRAASTERLGYKAAALFFALVLWAVASAEEPTEEVVPVRLTVALDTGLALVGERPTIHALVVGRSREVIKLYDRPPVIRRAFGADAVGNVHVDLSPADVSMPSGVDVTVRDVQPRSVSLRLAEVRSTTAADRVPPPVSTPAPEPRIDSTTGLLTPVIPTSPDTTPARGDSSVARRRPPR